MVRLEGRVAARYTELRELSAAYTSGVRKGICSIKCDPATTPAASLAGLCLLPREDGRGAPICPFMANGRGCDSPLDADTVNAGQHRIIVFDIEMDMSCVPLSLPAHSSGHEIREQIPLQRLEYYTLPVHVDDYSPAAGSRVSGPPVDLLL